MNGTSYAFGQTLQRGGIGFPYCADPSMVPVTISLNQSEYYESDFGRWFESYTVEVQCEQGAKIPLRVALDPDVYGILNETLYLEDMAGPCLLSFMGLQSWTSTNFSYQIFDGSNSSADSMLFMSEAKNITEDAMFPLPTLYSRCLKEALAGAIDRRHLYTGNYQDKAFSWVNNEVSKDDDCLLNQEYWIERYALVALSMAEEAPEGWINAYDHHCVWPRVKCDGSRVVELSYGKCIVKKLWCSCKRVTVFADTCGPFSQNTVATRTEFLKGLFGPEFTLFRHLGKSFHCVCVAEHGFNLYSFLAVKNGLIFRSTTFLKAQFQRQLEI